MEVGLAGAGQCLDGCVDHGRVQVCAGGVPGTGRVDGAVCSSQHAYDRRSVIEVDHGRRGAPGRDDVGLRVVANERRHLVAVLLQFSENVRSDETCCTGEGDSHCDSSWAFRGSQRC